MEEVCKTLLEHTGQDICKTFAEAGDGDICKGVLVGGGGVAAVLLTPALVTALGFTTTGVLAGSIAAKLMSLFAGGVLGGIVATLQSIGVIGLSWFSTVTVASTGGTVGWLLSAICNQTKPNED